MSYLEETNFELQQIQKEFLLQYNATPNFIKNGVEIESQATLENGNSIYLKTKVIGPKYYLLGCVNTSIAKKERFFNSFSPQKFNYKEELRLYTNKEVNFSILIPFESNKALFYDLEKNEIDTKNIFCCFSFIIIGTCSDTIHILCAHSLIIHRKIKSCRAIRGIEYRRC